MAEYRSLGSTWMIFLHMFSLLNLVKPISFSTLAITFKCKYMSLANSLDNILKELKASLIEKYLGSITFFVPFWSSLSVFQISCALLRQYTLLNTPMLRDFGREFWAIALECISFSSDLGRLFGRIRGFIPSFVTLQTQTFCFSKAWHANIPIWLACTVKVEAYQYHS